jgi:hypothetical protein
VGHVLPVKSRILKSCATVSRPIFLLQMPVYVRQKIQALVRASMVPEETCDRSTVAVSVLASSIWGRGEGGLGGLHSS